MPASPIMDTGAVKVYGEETLGIGSYGKVCKAKCGQLPCAAKLLHDTMFGTNDPGINKFVERFEQECQFLRMVKHPNIVQFLGTSRDPRSKRLALLMELMDESLTRFLELSPSPIPYHTQLDICHDVALALDYLHSWSRTNRIIHRDLSSNNVLLIGNGSRAKVTDFGMSKLVGMNPRMTPLTMCPGTSAYMPPEALVTPPRYSSKLDCFSHGVLTIQIATRQFPNPGDSHVEDPNEGLFCQVPETERRKKDIDLVDPEHPLLPLALHCLETKAKSRPSADELCEELASLKCKPMYTQSMKHSKEQNTSLQALQQEIQRKDADLQGARQEIREKDSELERSRSNHEIELKECHTKLQKEREEYKKKLNAKESMLEQVIADCQSAVLAKKAECEKNQVVIEQLQKEKHELKKQTQHEAAAKTKKPQAGVANNNLVEYLKSRGIIKDNRVEAAMKAVDRQNYCPLSPYMDAPQRIGFGTTISAPHMHAHALQSLAKHLKEGGTCLDVGSGSGYLTACMAHMVGLTGCTVGIDHIEELTELAMKNIRKDGRHLLESKRVILVTGDGRNGYPDRAPYDVIHVGAAADRVPRALHQQLKPGGRMIIPVGPDRGTQYLEQHDKGFDGRVTVKRLMGVRFVPLTSKEKQYQR